MTHKNYLVFLVFSYSFLTNTPELDDIDNLSQELFVSHYDCIKMQGPRTYLLHKVAEREVSPEKKYTAPVTFILLQKN